MFLQKGMDKGILSLLKESLNITRELLREAQLAYPRNQVRDPNHEQLNVFTYSWT